MHVEWTVGDVRIVKVVEHEFTVPLTGMLQDGQVTRARALELARMVLHDNAAKLYGTQ